MKKKVIFITGASSGIGLETAKVLAKNKNNVVYGGAREMTKFPNINALTLDVTDEKSCEKAISQIIKEQGRIDVLVNCAGYAIMGPIEEISIDDARKQLNTNLFGSVRLAKLVIPHMRKQHSGKIINLSSLAGRIPLYFADWYDCSKYAIEGISDNMRVELKPFGIRVILIEPGSIRSNWSIHALYSLDKATTGTPYLQYTKGITKFLHHQKYAVLTASSPYSVARIIRRAIKSKHPKARYLMGRFSHIAIIAKKLMPTFMYDYLMKKI